MWGVIGGTGFEKFDQFEVIDELDIRTPFGLASEGLKTGRIGEHKVVFIPRHGKRHHLLPSEVNYRANIYALKKYGVKQLISFSAVGSLREVLAPGDMVVPNQYIDRTKSMRDVSFLGSGVIGHVSLAHPTSKELTEALKGPAADLDFKVHFEQTAITVEGPYFSTYAESMMFRSFGADIIGMTAFPEYALAREAGISFLPCSFVTDYDCWKTDIPHVTVEEVLETMKKNNLKAFKAALKILEFDTKVLTAANSSSQSAGLKSGLMSSKETLKEEQVEVLTTLGAF